MGCTETYIIAIVGCARQDTARYSYLYKCSSRPKGGSRSEWWTEPVAMWSGSPGRTTWAKTPLGPGPRGPKPTVDLVRALKVLVGVLSEVRVDPCRRVVREVDPVDLGPPGSHPLVMGTSVADSHPHLLLLHQTLLDFACRGVSVGIHVVVHSEL